jgi:hypothetical protein
MGGAVSVYSSNAVGVNVNPLTTDSMGRFGFYAADGRYNLVVSFSGVTLAIITDILLEDPANPNAYTINGGSIDNTPIGNITRSTGKFTTVDTTTPISLASGGTGGTDPATARAAMSAAQSGVNNDITRAQALTRVDNTLLVGGATTTAALDGVSGLVAGAESGISGGLAFQALGSAWVLYTTNSSNELIIYNSTTNTVVGRFNAANNFVIDGNLGVGTSLPNRKLVVSNASAQGFEFGPGVGPSSSNELLNYNRSTSQHVPMHNFASAHFLYSGTAGSVLGLNQDLVGNVGVGLVPSAWGITGNVIDFQGNGTIGGGSTLSSNGLFIGNNWYYGSGAYRYKTTGTATQTVHGTGFSVLTAPSGTAGNPITFATLVNTNTNAVTTGANAAASALVVNRDTTTSRSINASGTINASGADYAEYERNGGLRFAKGDVVGFKADGTLTHNFDEAIRFGVKSTDPSIVGGDVWGSEKSLGRPCPQEPIFSKPQYSGAPDPGLTPELPSDASQEQQAEHDAAMQAHAAARYKHIIDKAEYDARVHTARHLFDTATWLEYERAKAAFDAALEDARQGVDRIAYAGKVPCNVTGATPGGYIIADSFDGKIVGQFVTKPSFDQYLRAVGRVNRILPDGRCEVAVIVH